MATLADAVEDFSGPRLCVCGCNREFTATNRGSTRKYFDNDCRHQTRQLRYINNHPEQKRAGAEKYRANNRVKIAAKARVKYEQNRDSMQEAARIRYSENLERERERSRKKANSPRRVDWLLQRNYGITLEEYGQLLSSQGEKCAICDTSTPGVQRKNSSCVPRWAVDHDHATGKVRGLLCENCNRGLGLFSDDVSRLTAAVAYLRKDR